MIFLALALLGSSGAFAQDDAIGKFFGKYLDDSRFTVISISPRMFRLIGSIKWDTVAAEVQEEAKKLTSFRAISTTTTPMVFYKEAMARIDLNRYEPLITVRNKDANTRFLIREEGGTIRELVMISVDNDQFNVISFVGDIDLDKLSKLTADLNFNGGLQHLQDNKQKNH